MSFNFKKSSAAALAALSIGFAIAPMQSAEAQWRGHRHGGYYRGGGVALGAGLLGGAILGGALLARPSYAAPVYVDEECRVVRQRVWDEYRGRWIHVRRTVCD